MIHYLENDYYLVLSAGRTGTVFLSEALTNQFPNVIAEHEPSPARWEHLRGNIRSRFGGNGERLLKSVCSARRNKLQSLPAETRYIELNPMLCPLADLLPRLSPRLHVVHLTRNPESWTGSILKFGASKRWRYLIDYIPYALPYPRPYPEGWSRFSKAEKTLWRWRFCNESILSIKPACATYAQVKYEDLFASETKLRESALESLLTTLQLPIPASCDWFPIEARKNAAPSSKKETAIPPETVDEICGPLMEKLGYAVPSLTPQRLRTH